MVRSLAIIFGIVLLILGIMGFLPTFTVQGKLFDLFRVNFEHNIFHITSGILAILCGLASQFAARLYFIIGGLLYLFLAGLGFLQNEEMLFEMIATNLAANYLHAIIGALSLIIGLRSKN